MSKLFTSDDSADTSAKLLLPERQAGWQILRDMPVANDELAQLKMAAQQVKSNFSLKALLLVLVIHAMGLFGLLLLNPVQHAEFQVPEPAAMMVSLVGDSVSKAVPEVVEIVPEPESKPVIKKPEPLQKVAESTLIPEQIELAPAPAISISEPLVPTEPISAPVPVVAKQETPVVQEIPVVKEVIEPPKLGAAYLHNPSPQYPPVSRRIGEEGRVLLRVLVAKNGDAEAVEIESGSGSARLDEAAFEAVKKWRFIPATRNSQPISAYVIVPIQFRLNS